jgi:adenine deaminase
MVAEKGNSLINQVEVKQPNKFFAAPIRDDQIRVKAEGEKMKVIKAYDGELITGVEIENPKTENGYAVSDTGKDILKIVVVNRYQENAKPTVAFIKNFGIKTGAIASSVAHDSHNIVAVGVDDEDIVKAINLVIDKQGGVSVVNNNKQLILPLPVAGLMSHLDGYEVAEKYHNIDKEVHLMGSKLRAPFMTLSFMALLVIPELKLSDKGLFDGNTFSFTGLFT